MRRLRLIDGAETSGLDARLARLARVHDAAIVTLAASLALLFVVALMTALGDWSDGPAFWARLSLGALALVAVMSVATIYMVAMVSHADAYTERGRRTHGRTDDEA